MLQTVSITWPKAKKLLDRQEICCIEFLSESPAMKNIVALILSAAALIAVSYWGLTVLVATQGVELSLHGKIAMGLGIVFTMAVGFGLMALLFYSNRGGHDDTVYNASTNEPNVPDQNDTPKV